VATRGAHYAWRESRRGRGNLRQSRRFPIQLRQLTYVRAIRRSAQRPPVERWASEGHATIGAPRAIARTIEIRESRVRGLELGTVECVQTWL
jgi:hypothetical protein